MHDEYSSRATQTIETTNCIAALAIYKHPVAYVDTLKLVVAFVSRLYHCLSRACMQS